MSKRLSFRIVRREFRMAEFALKISSRNATEAVGRYPCDVQEREEGGEKRKGGEKGGGRGERGAERVEER